MNEVDFYTQQAMMIYGGSFVKALGNAFGVADSNNRKKLKVAFSQYFEQYEKMGEDQNPRSKKYVR